MNGIVALAAWGLAELTLLPTAAGRPITPIWPPAGLAVALVYIGGYRLLPGIVLGSFALGLRYNALPVAALLALAQIAQPVIDVRIMRALKFDPKLETHSRSDHPVPRRRTGGSIRRGAPGDGGAFHVWQPAH